MGDVVPGVDVAFLQGKIDWQKVADSGIKFAIIRAGESLYTPDSAFARNVSGAKAAGLLTGAYYVFHPGVDAVQQAEKFHKIAGGLVDLPPALDLEVRGTATPAQYVTQLQNLVNMTESLFGRGCMLYTAPYFWREMCGQSGDTFQEQFLWIANYGVQQPSIPKPWVDWNFWQYSGDGGHVPGVSTDCDRDFFNGTLDDLNNLALGTA